MIVIRYEGPKGGPGMPEMLTPTSAIMGAGLGKVGHNHAGEPKSACFYGEWQTQICRFSAEHSIVT